MTTDKRATRYSSEAPKRTAIPSAHSAILYGVVALLLMGPLAFGAVEPWSIFLLQAGSVLMFAAWAWVELQSPRPAVRWNPIFFPMIAFGALILVQIAARTSAYSYATRSTAMLFVAYGALCFLVVQCLRTPKQIRTLTKCFSFYGFAVAAFALFQGLAPNGKLYWLRMPRGGGWIYGPYVNHNHYAGLMEMLVAVPLVFSLTTFARGQTRAAAIFISALMSTTIFLSGSRGGMVSFCVEIILLLGALLGNRRNIPAQGRYGFVFFGALLAFLLILIAIPTIKQRVTRTPSSQTELSQDLRMQIDKDVIKMAPRRPLLGWGLGTFADVYPSYRTFYTTFYLDEAHNDYLQLLVETGAAGFATMIWFLWIALRGAAVKLRNWPGSLDGAVALSTLLGMVGIMVHSLVDFNLQVPANAALFYVFCTVAAMKPGFDSIPPN